MCIRSTVATFAVGADCCVCAKHGHAQRGERICRAARSVLRCASRCNGRPADGDFRSFRPDQFPVKLPPVSLLGARNDLPNPYRPGVSWGQLPEGRKWGSTASITTAPDGKLWVVDRCGVSGAGGTTCAGANAGVNPVFQFDMSGKLLKSFGAGMFVSPHKLSVDKEGNLWLADNGGQQIFKLTQDGKILLTLGKKGVAGAGPR